MQPLVDLQGAGLKRGRATIVSDIDFQVNPGEHWVIVGPNGAGKTTLARLVSARDYPTSGTATVLGADTSGEDATYIASRIGVAAADMRERVVGADSVLDVVVAAAWGQTSRFDEDYEDADTARAKDLLAALGMSGFENRSFASLSEGEKQRVSIARALMADPEIVILDEPTAGLDLGARETLLLAMSEIMGDPKSPSILLITHEIEEIAPGFTHALLMNEGTVVKAGPIADVLTSANLSDVFGLPLEVSSEGGRWWARALHS